MVASSSNTFEFSIPRPRRKLNNMDENRRQPLGHHLKPKQPPEFSGRNSKWSNNVVEWLFMVEQYFGIVSGEIQDAQAVRYAGTLLTENAASMQPAGGFLSDPIIRSLVGTNSRLL
jgi:hypothetical protein